MKYEGGLFEARSIGELDAQLRGGLSENGFRIVNVLDRSSLYDDRFLIVAQKDVDAQIHIAGGPSEDIRFGTNGR